jgi:hypothetical protein
VRLARSVAAIESLQKLKEEGKISDGDFATELERDKDELEEALSRYSSTEGPSDILRSRASGAYSTLVTLPMSRAMQILRINRMEKPIQSIIEKATAKDEDGNQQKSGTGSTSGHDGGEATKN